MKKTLLIASLMLTAGVQAQVVDSGFEAWTGGEPDGWVGSKTHTSNLVYSQVTEDVHGGTSAVGLATTGADHRRFTTQPVTVEANVEYTVTFWVRGGGQVRVGLFDERPSGSGYAPYSGWTTATATWAQVSQTVTAVQSSTAAEFIFSVQSATEPNIIVIDDVNISSTGGLQELSIYDIQFTSAPDGASTHAEEIVSTSGIVTATYVTLDDAGEPEYRYTYIQDGTGAWNGIVVFDYADNNNTSNIGDAVTVVATVAEFNGLTELTGIQSFTVTATGQTVPAPVVTETGDVASEPFESVLVRVEEAACTLVPSGATFGKWNVSDGTGDAIIGKVLYTVTPAPVLGQVFDITGVVSFAFSEYNIQPRFAADVETTVGVNEIGVLNTVNVFPNPATDNITLTLGAAAGQRVEYTLTDALGRSVIAGVVRDERIALNVQSLNNGVYHLTLRTAEFVRTLQVQVVR
ncbi:MAG TPA: T9SS type A sorting domain-containing protein [Flavobacteriales bacterium]